MTSGTQRVTHILSAIEVLSYMYEPCVWVLLGKNGGNNYIRDFIFPVWKFREAGENESLFIKRDLSYIKFYNNKTCTLFYEARGNIFLFTKHNADSLIKDN
jgi:hypothetical protein